jgi:hypothetical protein
VAAPKDTVDGTSLSTMVTVVLPVCRSCPCWVCSALTVKVSLPSNVVSLVMGTAMLTVATPAAKLRVPLRAV